MAYLTGFGRDAWIGVENPRLGVTARLAWDGEALPVCWAWQEFASGVDWPWFGRAYVIGLEPFAGPPPNARLGPRAGEEPLDFAPGESRTIRLAASAAWRRA